MAQCEYATVHANAHGELPGWPFAKVGSEWFPARFASARLVSGRLVSGRSVFGRDPAVRACCSLVPPARSAGKSSATEKCRRFAELLFYAEQPVVLGDAI
jgi:hypothetical protein